MKLFISYSRRDALLLDPLLADLGRAGHEVLIDRRIPGGQLWWDEIIENLRRCDALIFVVSPYAIESKACRLELAYGVGDLRKPLLPVMLRETNIDPHPGGSNPAPDYSTCLYMIKSCPSR